MSPIEAIGSALFGLIPGMAMGASQSGTASTSGPATPPTPSQAAPVTQSPVGVDATGTKAGGTNKPQTSSFIGSAAVPAQSGYGQKSLLGQ